MSKRVKIFLSVMLMITFVMGNGGYIPEVKAADISNYEALVAAAAAGGTYNLTGNIIVTAPITIPKGKTLTLRATSSGYVIYTRSAIANVFVVQGTLNLGASTTDTLLHLRGGTSATVQKTTNSIIQVDGGTVNINNAYLAYSNAHAIELISKGTCNFRQGIISDNKALNSTSTAGGAVIVKNASIFNMVGGTIKKNAYGGAYVMSGGTFNMTGGSISENQIGAGIPDRAGYGYGGGVYVAGAFHMSGGTIKANSAKEQGKGVCIASTGKFEIKGSAAIVDNDVYLGSATAKVYVADALTASGTALTITPYAASNLDTVLATSSVTVMKASDFINKIALNKSGYDLKADGRDVKLTKRYTVSYNGNGGTKVPDNASAFYNDTITISTVVPERVGFTFKSWNTKIDGTGISILPGKKGFKVTGAITLYAKWEENNITVQYDAMGGVNGPVAETQLYSTGIKVSNVVPQKEGCTFYGWNTKPDGSGRTYEVGELVQEDVVLYAQWNDILITVQYNYVGAEGGPVDQKGIFSTGIYISSIVPVREGYIFKSWNTNQDGTGQSYVGGEKVQNNLNLYAQWEGNTAVLSYVSGGGLNAPDNQSYPYGTTVTISETIPIRVGYNFKQWNTAEDGTGMAYLPGAKMVITANTTLYPIWETTLSGAGRADILAKLEPKLTATYNKKASLKLACSVEGGADGYEIYYATKKTGSYKALKEVDAAGNLTYSDSKLKKGATYYFKIKAYVTENEKRYYSKESSIVSGTLLKKPTIKSVTSTKNKIKVTWKPTSDVSGYMVYQKIGKKSYKKVYTASKKAVSIILSSKSIKKGTKCSYKIKVYKKVNGKKIYSVYSKVKSVKKK